MTWEDVAFGTMVGRSSLRYNSLESKLLKLAQKTCVPRPPDPISLTLPPYKLNPNLNPTLTLP